MNDTPSHDAVGSMTDDGKYYKFVYDARGRPKTVKNQSNTVVAEYTYNGLNMRIGWHYDADADADVDANDPWYSFAHDDRWRIVATFRGSDTSPKELFAYHNAGMNGRGSSSHIDSVMLRNKDANTSWTSASDGTLEERLYYGQNWRADVSAILSSAGVVKEWIKYTSYGIPVRIDPGDYNRDGFVNGADFDDYGDDFDNARSEADVNFDTVVNGDDYDLFSEWWDAPSTAGRFTLSASSVANRIGYAGYQYDPTFVGASRAIFHVRNRVYEAGLGRWLRRDPAGYVGGFTLYAHVSNQPYTMYNPYGLKTQPCEGKPVSVVGGVICDATTYSSTQGKNWSTSMLFNKLPFSFRADGTASGSIIAHYQDKYMHSGLEARLSAWFIRNPSSPHVDAFAMSSTRLRVRSQCDPNGSSDELPIITYDRKNGRINFDEEDVHVDEGQLVRVGAIRVQLHGSEPYTTELICNRFGDSVWVKAIKVKAKIVFWRYVIKTTDGLKLESGLDGGGIEWIHTWTTEKEEWANDFEREYTWGCICDDQIGGGNISNPR